MQNSGYPFDQKEHVFDFKVKVNFENGNVSLTAPKNVTPPAYFVNLPSHQPSQPSHQPSHLLHTSSSLYSNQYNNSSIQRNTVSNNFTST